MCKQVGLREKQCQPEDSAGMFIGRNWMCELSADYSISIAEWYFHVSAKVISRHLHC